MHIRQGLALSLSAAFVAVLVGCSGTPAGDPTGAVAPAGDPTVAAATPDVSNAECFSALKDFTAGDSITGVSDGTELSNEQLSSQVTELFGEMADPVLSLLTPESCAVLNSVSSPTATVWNIVVPGLDADTAEGAAVAMDMEQVAAAGGGIVYGPISSKVPDAPRLMVYREQPDFAIPHTAVLGLEIRAPLASSIDTADANDLNGHFCLDSACDMSWEIEMPVRTITGARTITSQLDVVGKDSGCLLVGVDGSSDGALVYCPAGVPTPESIDYYVSGDDEGEDRIWEATPGGPGTDAYLRQ